MSTPEITRHDLPSGNWIEIRDPRVFRRQDKHRVLAAVKDDASAIAIGLQIVDELLALSIVGWSYDLPLPGEDHASLGQLPLEDDVALAQAVEPARLMLMPNAPSVDQHADPASPTGPSSE